MALNRKTKNNDFMVSCKNRIYWGEKNQPLKDYCNSISAQFEDDDDDDDDEHVRKNS